MLGMDNSYWDEESSVSFMDLYVRFDTQAFIQSITKCLKLPIENVTKSDL